MQKGGHKTFNKVICVYLDISVLDFFYLEMFHPDKYLIYIIINYYGNKFLHYHKTTLLELTYILFYLLLTILSTLYIILE